MDRSNRLYQIKTCEEEKIIFKEDSLNKRNNKQSHDHNHISEEFAKYFSIDNDDDDIILLDPFEIINNEVKLLLDDTINNIIEQDSQIINSLNKRSLDSNNDEECLLNKKVRWNNSNHEDKQEIPSLSSSSCLFLSEKINTNNFLTSTNQFLSNLGYDLCLEYNLNQDKSLLLSENDTEKLHEYNKIFHKYPYHSCKYCSFKTNTIYVMDNHYRTPHIYHHDKYRCTYCLFNTFSLSVLRRHYFKKHHCNLIIERNLSKYLCNYCSYETQEKNSLQKHKKLCEIQQKKTDLANNLLAPNEQLINTQLSTNNKTKNNSKNKTKTKVNDSTDTINHNDIIEPILIESDHDSSLLSQASSSSSSDEDFIVSSDEESSSSTDTEHGINRNMEISMPRPPPPSLPVTQQSMTKSLVNQSLPIAQTTNNLSSLSKLLLLNGAPMPSYTPLPLNSNKSPLIPIQPKPPNGADIYQMCNICQCYIFKNDYIKHMNEKHSKSLTTQQTISTPIIILNNPTNTTNTSVTCLKPTLIISNETSQAPPATTIFLLSTSNMNSQSSILSMIKCPWCDTNFEHIDIMTGHLMRYHRMTLAASKVVVAEQMKMQSPLAKELTVKFKNELQNIQKLFNDKIYWKISQPKVYLHQIETISCFVCNINVDDIENHFSTIHKIPLITMNTLKHCCLCGFDCDKKNISLFEHQLRIHSGVCYSSILKQFIRFDPPPPSVAKTILPKANNRPVPISSLSAQRSALTTSTEKKFGCRKCATSSGLFTFEELVEHLRIKHNLNVKLHRRCIICQQTYPKGKEYNQHCLEHLNDENPSIKIQRKYLTKSS